MNAKASSSRRLASRAGLGLAAVCAALLTASCAAGQHAATANETPAIDGTTGALGPLKLAAVAVSPPPVSCYLTGGTAALSLIIVNSGTSADTLNGVSSTRFKSSIVAANPDDASAYTQGEPGTGSCAPTPGASTSAAPEPSQPLPDPAAAPKIGAGQSLQLGLTGTGSDAPAGPVIVLRGLTGGPLYAGESIPVTFTFASAGSITLTVPVQLSVAPNHSTVPAGSDAPVG